MEFEEAALRFRFSPAVELRLQLLDAGIGALKRLVLDERRLRQRVKGMWRAAKARCDQALGLRIALQVFNLGQAIE